MTDLSIVIPVHNEQARITKTVARILNYLDHSSFSCEIILVENGSTDNTSYLAKRLSQVFRDENVITYAIPERGKGWAVRRGMLYASGNWILMVDCDLPTPVEQIGRFWSLRNRADILIGNRERSGEPVQRVISGMIFKMLVNWLVLPDIHDSQCGFKLFLVEAARDIFWRLTTHGMAFDVEALMLARRLNYSISEITLPWKYDPNSRVRLVRDSWQMFRDVLRLKRGILANVLQRPRLKTTP